MTSFRNQVLAAAVAVIGGFLQSYVTCIIAGALSFISHEFHLTPLNEGWIASSVLLGALLGSMSSGYLADRLGRRASLQLSALLFILSGLGVLFIHSFSSLLLIRLAAGFAAGMTSLLVPLYLSEIAPASWRGAFVTTFMISITVGTLAAYLVGYAFASSGNWRVMFSLAAAPAIVQFIAFFFLPHGQVAEISKETVRSKWRDLFSPSVRFVLWLGIALTVFQQLSGINAVIYFAPKIFKQAGFIEAKQALFPMLLIGTVNVIASCIAMFLIDRIGRKKILLASQLGIITALLSLAYAFATKNSRLGSWAAIALIGYVGTYSLGKGPVTWVIISEIYPLAVRAKAIAVMAFLSWLTTYIVVFTFPPFLAKVGCALPFLIYALSTCVAFALFLLYLPETKGKTLKELEMMLKRKV